MSASQTSRPPSRQDDLSARFRWVRERTELLAAPLSEADMTVQSMEDTSPTKWHLAHTTWFFEEFILTPLARGYQVFSSSFQYLFNSYYEAVGPRHPRPRRGLLTRPGLDEVLAYRRAVDEAMEALLGAPSPEAAGRVELGLQHEEQHQELLLTDILHLFAQNPLRPAYFSEPFATMPATPPARRNWVEFPGSQAEIGHGGEDFAFDCEGPRHPVIIPPHALASALVTNGEWLEFMADGGYRQAALWLADGWVRVQTEAWHSPLYWDGEDEDWQQMGLRGPEPLDPLAPVSHISFFEADAFARWAGKRLPTEFEWENAAAGLPVVGNFLDSTALKPLPAPATSSGLAQMYGDAWEWTSSAFLPYPGFRSAGGALGEYNGKFMCGQMVLRGGSCLSPGQHLRATYRNFFYPHQRWQCTGLRLASDL